MSLVLSGRATASSLFPGVMTCAIIALAASFLSEHYGGPPVLYALLLGLSLHALMTSPKMQPGVGFASRGLLRVAVALLGMRITLPQVTALGWTSALLVTGCVGATILFGCLLARWTRRPLDEGLLSGCGVAICGASAAMAVAAVLAPTRENQRYTLLVVAGVTTLSTLAMVLYPPLAALVVDTPTQTGFFLGSSIHDVAQVIAAGAIAGPEAADVAVIVKLFRVALLVPVVVMVLLLYRPAGAAAGQRLPRVPGFLLAFVGLMLVNSTGILPQPLTEWGVDASRTLLVVAIAAAGMNTSLEELMKLGWTPLLLLIGETLFLAGIVLAGVSLAW